MLQLINLAICQADKIANALNRDQHKEASSIYQSWCHGKLEVGRSLTSLVSQYKPDGPSRTLDIMASSLIHHCFDKWQELGNDVSVRILLPAASDLNHLEESLSSAKRASPRCSIEVRFFSTPLDFGMTKVDDLVFVCPDLTCQSSNKLPIVLLGPNITSNNDNYRYIQPLFTNYFEMIWVSSMPMNIGHKSSLKI